MVLFRNAYLSINTNKPYAEGGCGYHHERIRYLGEAGGGVLSGMGV